MKGRIDEIRAHPEELKPESYEEKKDNAKETKEQKTMENELSLNVNKPKKERDNDAMTQTSHKSKS